MTLYRVQVVIPATTNVVADAIVNDWTVNLTGGTTPEATFVTALKTFYDTWGSFRGAGFSWTTARAKFYRMEDPPPRVPAFDLPLGLSSSVAINTLPREVALCLSFQALRVSGANQARRRNRVYLGPFSTASNNGTTGRPDTSLTTPMRTGAQALLDASNTSTDWEWAIHSTLIPPTTIVPVHDGWIDDAWDTQRRRGLAPASRVTFSVVP